MSDAPASGTRAGPARNSLSSPLAEAILAGTAPRAMRLAAARGALPLGRPDLFRLAVSLTGDADAEIASQARANINAWPRDEMLQLGSDAATDPAALAFLAAWSGSDSGILAAVLSNAAIPIAPLMEAAREFSSERIDTLFLNQTLIIKHPTLLDSVEANPNATPLQRARIEEMRRHFLAPAAPDRKEPGPAGAVTPGVSPAAVPSSPDSAVSVPPAAPAHVSGLQAASAHEGAPEAAGSAPAGGEPIAVSVMQRIMSLSVGDKIQVAFKGTREERTILIRDSNRSVQEAVLSSPKISESEVDAIARMRNVNEDVLRQISMSRDWMKSYAITQGLATNPKTPLGVSMSLLPRLTTRDLKALQNDKNVPDALRRVAQKTLLNRAAKPGGGPRGGR